MLFPFVGQESRSRTVRCGGILVLLLLCSCQKTIYYTPATSSSEIKSKNLRSTYLEKTIESSKNSTSVTAKIEDKDDTEEEDDLDEIEDELEKISGPELDYKKLDPFEGPNRVLYQLHRGMDLLIIRPLAMTYSKVLPNPVKNGLYNFVKNITAPVRIMSWLLQGNLEEAGKTAGKFVTNTFLGIGGIFDISKKFGLEEASTGFAETFKKWKIPTGPYVLVPGIGPATLRTTVGFLFDSFLDPVFLLTLNKGLPYNENRALMWSDSVAQVTYFLIGRSKIDMVYENIEKNSIDRYSKLRTLILQLPINK